MTMEVAAGGSRGVVNFFPVSTNVLA
jgi:hypothetical protein